ncbi:DUF58 domain-containing protein [Halocola ammonii]
MKTTWRVLKQFQLNGRFFLVIGALVVLLSLGFLHEPLFIAGKLALVLFAVVCLVDCILLAQNKNLILGSRKTPKLFSLGDENEVKIHLMNRFSIKLFITIYDELPVQFQQRDFQMKISMAVGERRILKYSLLPLVRGEYAFGKINLLISSKIGLLSRRIRKNEEHTIPVYPSIIQMKKYELMAFASISNFHGIKKMRRLGHSYEFEQIKTYVQGDDVRSINWKATSRKNQLMVNQYEDERSQQVYSIIDKSRSMRMPFNGLSLLDYAINTSLVISNIALKKHDKTGLISFSDKMGSTIRADKGKVQLKKILQALYNEKEARLEANYELLFHAIRNIIKSRSLIFLYLNFESAYALERALPVLRRINAHHLLVVMIFENTELEDYSTKKAEYIRDIYTQTIAQKMVLEKKHLAIRLRKQGIQTILTKPEDLSMNTVNKYLELKARGLI